MKNLFRQGWLKRGISELDCETVAEHSFGVALLGYTIAEEYFPYLDSSRVLKLALFHELGEIYAGDITPSDNISEEEKSRKEHDAVKRLFAKFPNPEKYINTWLEYEHQKTPEAKFVKQIDRLEMALQARLYEEMNYTGLDEFFSYVKQRMPSSELKPLLDEIIKIRK